MLNNFSHFYSHSNHTIIMKPLNMIICITMVCISIKRSRSNLTKRYWWVLITYIIGHLSILVTGPLLINFSPLGKFDAVIYAQIAGFVLSLLAILIILRHEIKQKSAPGAADIPTVILWTIVGLFMAFAAQIISVSIEVNLFNIKTNSENTADIMEITRQIPVFMLVTAIIAPILEEIVFRKIIFGSLYKRMNFFWAGTISALIFGFIHFEPIHILIYASMGFVFAFLYVKTKRIIVPILVHMGMNSIVVLAQYSLTPEDIENMQKQLEQMQILIGG